MITVLNRDSGKKLYIQLAEVIRGQIQAGQMQEGQILATEDSFCKKYEVYSQLPSKRILKPWKVGK